MLMKMLLLGHNMKIPQLRILHLICLCLVGLTFLLIVYHYTNNVLYFKITNDVSTSKPHTKLLNKTFGVITEQLYKSEFDIPNVNLCPHLGYKLKLLVTVTSAPEHREERMAIRSTWGFCRVEQDVTIAFLLGTANKYQVNNFVEAEANQFGDIIRTKLIDTYENLGLKSVALTDWVDNYCSRVKFVLKTDDDTFINIPKLLTFINKHYNEKRTIYGRLATSWKPFRDSCNKYYISVNQFPARTWPDFVTGPAYLLTGDLMHDLYKHALNHTYLKLEDVFITGFVADLLNVKRVNVYQFLNERIESTQYYAIKHFISVHMVKVEEQFALRRQLLYFTDMF